jgi:uncharacterized protein YggE
VGAGANTIRSVLLVPSETAVTAAQQQATRLAVANAIAYGRLILGELGCQAVGVGAVTLTPLYAPMSSSVRSTFTHRRVVCVVCRVCTDDGCGVA